MTCHQKWLGGPNLAPRGLTFDTWGLKGQINVECTIFSKNIYTFIILHISVIFLSELKFSDEIVQLLKTNPGHGSHDSDEMTEEEGSGHMSHFPHNV